MKFQNRKSFFQVILVVIYCLVIVYSGKNLTFSVDPRPMVIQLCHDDEGLIVHLWVHYLIFFFFIAVSLIEGFTSLFCTILQGLLSSSYDSTHPIRCADEYPRSLVQIHLRLRSIQCGSYALMNLELHFLHEYSGAATVRYITLTEH